MRRGRARADRAATGRVLAEPPRRADLPPFPSSAMDGYAVRSADRERIRDAAGRRADRGREPRRRPLEAGEAMGIATGGAVPEGADAVVPIEVVDEAERDGRRGRRQGGRTLASGGRRPRASRCSSPVSCSARRRSARSPPRALPRSAAQASAGRHPRHRLGASPARRGARAGQIYESNGLLLAAALQRPGPSPRSSGSSPMTEEEHGRAIERALLGFDMLVTTGRRVGRPARPRAGGAGRPPGRRGLLGRALKPGKPVASASAATTWSSTCPATRSRCSSPSSCSSAGGQRAARLAARCPLSTGRLAHPSTEPAPRRVRQGDAGGRGRRRARAPGGPESHMIVRGAGGGSGLPIEAGEGEVPAGSPVRFLEI